eukprot:scpid88126/ scgid13328/ 
MGSLPWLALCVLASVLHISNADNAQNEMQAGCPKTDVGNGTLPQAASGDRVGVLCNTGYGAEYTIFTCGSSGWEGINKTICIPGVCNNGLIFQSGCRCLAGWMGKNCTKRAVTFGVNPKNESQIQLWFVPVPDCAGLDAIPCLRAGQGTFIEAVDACHHWGLSSPYYKADLKFIGENARNFLKDILLTTLYPTLYFQTIGSGRFSPQYYFNIDNVEKGGSTPSRRQRVSTFNVLCTAIWTYSKTAWEHKRVAVRYRQPRSNYGYQELMPNVVLRAVPTLCAGIGMRMLGEDEYKQKPSSFNRFLNSNGVDPTDNGLPVLGEDGVIKVFTLNDNQLERDDTEYPVCIQDN